MGDVVNLNQFRKRRGRERDAAQAAENRVRYGTPKADKSTRQQEQTRRERELDGKRLEREDDSEDQ